MPTEIEMLKTALRASRKAMKDTVNHSYRCSKTEHRVPEFTLIEMKQALKMIEMVIPSPPAKQKASQCEPNAFQVDLTEDPGE